MLYCLFVGDFFVVGHDMSTFLLLFFSPMVNIGFPILSILYLHFAIYIQVSYKARAHKEVFLPMSKFQILMLQVLMIFFRALTLFVHAFQ